MPIIGGQGPGSQIAWRGNLDEYPDDFLFPSIVDVTPGIAVTSSEVTITGINYKALLTAVGSACSVSVNDGDFLPGNDSNNPIILRNNDTVKLRVQTESASEKTDFNRVYSVDVTIGTRSTAVWSVTTNEIDSIPDPFEFTNQSGLETDTQTLSNIVTVTGIDATVGVDVFVTSSSGELKINGGAAARSGTIVDGDTLQLVNRTSNSYNTDITTTIQIGTFVRSFVISTRSPDTSIDTPVFNSVTGVDINSTQTSNTITISGADPSVDGNNPLPISITGGLYKITRSGQIISNYTNLPGTTQNGDKITLRLTAGDYETTTTATVTISGTSSSFSATTIDRPFDTIPNQFTFTDQNNVGRNQTITSNTITLSGMTEFGNEATATISSLSGVNAKFKVERGGIIVRNYSSSSFGVRNGDKITLQLTSSSNSLGSASATFTVTGSITPPGTTGSISDTWIVRSAQRVCTINDFTLTNQTGSDSNLEPGQLAVTSFTVSGFDSDCGISINTSNGNSYLKIGSNQGVNLSNVQNGDVVEIYMSTPFYDQTRSTTITVSSSFGTSKTATWTIGPKNPPLPTLQLDAQDRNVPFVFPDGGTAVLTYAYENVTNTTTTTNFGLSSIDANTLSSGELTGEFVVDSLAEGSTTFTMQVSNSSGTTTDSVTIIVGDPAGPTVTLCPTDTSSCSSSSSKGRGESITLYWKTTNAVTTESPDFSTGGEQNGSATITNLTEDNQVFTITAFGPGNNPATAVATHTVNLRPFIQLTANKSSVVTGEAVTLTWTSDYATQVVSTSGPGFSTTDLNGSVTLIPSRGNITYGITVRDAQGLESTSSVSIVVTDDVSVNTFTMNPSTKTNVNRSSEHTSEPSFSGSNSVTGLSPGASVTASVSGGTFDIGGPTKVVQNGTPTSDLRIKLTASENYSSSKSATLNIGGVSASFTVTTEACVVENSTLNYDGMSIATRKYYGYDVGNNVIFNDFGIRSVTSGGSAIAQRSGNGTLGSQEWGSGTYTWVVPNGVTSVTCSTIGGGGGAWFAGGGGGGASRSTISCTPGDTFTITVGSGGNGTTDGGSTTISGSGSNIVAGGGVSSSRSDLFSSSGIGGAGTSGNGGDGQGATYDSAGNVDGGHGGGAGRVSGGTCSNGSSSCGGSGVSNGGGPGKGSNVATGVCSGDNCANTSSAGLNGNNYGAGASGSARGYTGGAATGADGRARIDWTINFPEYAKNQVVYQIKKAYWDKINRPPTPSEFIAYYDKFKNDPGWAPTTSDLYNQVYSEVSDTAVTSTTDNCGNAAAFEDIL